MLTTQINSRIQIYKQLMAKPPDEDLSGFLSEKTCRRCWVAKSLFPGSKGLAPELDRIIAEVSRYYEVGPRALKAVRRGIKNEPRDVAIYLIRSMRSEPLMRIGAGFGLNRYSSVSSVIMRVKTRLQKDRKFKERVAHIQANILKSQM